MNPHTTRLLFKDYFRRNIWGLLVLVMAPLDVLADGVTFVGFSAILGPALLSFQRRYGSFDVWAQLPVTRVQRVGTAWCFAVLLWPALYFLATLVCAPLTVLFDATPFDPVTRLLLLFFAIGWASFMSTLVPFLPRTGDQPVGGLHQSWLAFVGGAWGLCVPGGIGLPVYLSGVLGGVPTATLLGASLPLLTLPVSGWLLSREVLGLPLAFGDRAPVDTAPTWPRFRGAGVGRVLLQIASAALSVGLTIAMLPPVLNSLVASSDGIFSIVAPVIVPWLLVMPMSICFQWLPCVRAIRVLPLQYPTFFTATVVLPCALGWTVMAAMSLAFYFLWGVSVSTLLSSAVLVGGGTFLADALAMRYTGAKLMVCYVLGIALFSGLVNARLDPVILASIGVLAGGSGLWACYRMARRSATLYRKPLGFFGAHTARTA